MKRERRALMDSLAALKADQGKAGSERQMSDIARLRRELESKQEKINELRQVRRLLQRRLGALACTQGGKANQHCMHCRPWVEGTLHHEFHKACTLSPVQIQGMARLFMMIQKSPDRKEVNVRDMLHTLVLPWDLHACRKSYQSILWPSFHRRHLCQSLRSP